MLNADKLRAGRLDRTDQLVELCLHCCCVTVLRILDKEDHLERHDRRRGVHHQLLSIGIAEYRAGCRPDQDDSECADERAWLSGKAGHSCRDGGEYPVHHYQLTAGKAGRPVPAALHNIEHSLVRSVAKVVQRYKCPEQHARIELAPVNWRRQAIKAKQLSHCEPC